MSDEPTCEVCGEPGIEDLNPLLDFEEFDPDVPEDEDNFIGSHVAHQDCGNGEGWEES